MVHSEVIGYHAGVAEEPLVAKFYAEATLPSVRSGKCIAGYGPNLGLVGPWCRILQMRLAAIAPLLFVFMLPE